MVFAESWLRGFDYFLILGRSLNHGENMISAPGLHRIEVLCCIAELEPLDFRFLKQELLEATFWTIQLNMGTMRHP